MVCILIQLFAHPSARTSLRNMQKPFIFSKMSTNREIYSTIRAKGDRMKKNKKGFTLVEIIVVLVIIGILLALAVPAVMSYVKEAADTKLISEARAVMVASKEKGTELVQKISWIYYLRVKIWRIS